MKPTGTSLLLRGLTYDRMSHTLDLGSPPHYLSKSSYIDNATRDVSCSLTVCVTVAPIG